MECCNWLLGSWRDGGEAESVCLLLCSEGIKPIQSLGKDRVRSFATSCMAVKPSIG